MSAYTRTIRYSLGGEYVTIVVRKENPIMVLCTHVGTEFHLREDRVTYLLKTLDGQYLSRDLTDLRPKDQQRDIELKFEELVQQRKKELNITT